MVPVAVEVNHNEDEDASLTAIRSWSSYGRQGENPINAAHAHWRVT